MRSFSSFALGLLGAASLAVASDVHDLKSDTFKDFIKDHDLVLAEFFAPWCGHCKALAPEYEEAATALKEKDISLVKVDCTEQTELCQEYNVEGYPTLKVFRGPDNVAAYGGPRKAQAIISYMTKQALPAVSILAASGLEEFKTADKVVLVGYFAADDKASNETFTAAANKQRDNYLFGAINDAAVAEAEGVKQPAIVLYKSFDEGKNVFEDKWEVEAIEKFASVAATPLVGEVGPETYSGYMAAGIPLAYIFAETEEERSSLSKELKTLAEKHKGVINFATIDAKAFGQHGGNLNLEVGKWPAFAIQDIGKNTKYPYDQTKKIDLASITEFVDDFVAGKIEPSIKSEPIPENQDGPVTVVVAHNYKAEVLDNEKDVLLEFYAPWCGHCKALAPKYDELGTMAKEFSDKVVIAKVDATTNDVPDDIQGFPTIKLFPAGKKDSPVAYSGDRTIEDLIKFIKENGSHKVDVSSGSAAAADSDDTPSSSGAAADATEAVKSKVSEAAEAVKSAASDSDDGAEIHDEL